MRIPMKRITVNALVDIVPDHVHPVAHLGPRSLFRPALRRWAGKRLVNVSQYHPHSVGKHAQQFKPCIRRPVDNPPSPALDVFPEYQEMFHFKRKRGMCAVGIKNRM